jgi:addiction module HigA family antidote
MSGKPKTDPSLIIHPGEILVEELLNPYGLTPSSLASRLGLPAKRVTAVATGTRGITSKTAILFGTAFGTSPEFWLNLQARYELDSAMEGIAENRLKAAERLHRDLSVAGERYPPGDDRRGVPSPR